MKNIEPKRTIINSKHIRPNPFKNKANWEKISSILAEFLSVAKFRENLAFPKTKIGAIRKGNIISINIKSKRIAIKKPK